MKKPDWSRRANEMNIGCLMLEIMHLLCNWLQEICLPLSVAGSGKGRETRVKVMGMDLNVCLQTEFKTTLS